MVISLRCEPTGIKYVAHTVQTNGSSQVRCRLQSNPLVQQAINNHRALYGTEPTYEPYRGASDHPFEGIHEDIVRDLLNRDEVDKYLKNYKKELAKKHKSIGVYSYVAIKGDPQEGLMSLQCTSKWVLVSLPQGWVKFYPRSKIVSRVPEPSERDQFSDTLGKTIHHGHEYTYGTRVLEIANMREGIIIEDFSNPLGYTDPSLPVIPFSGVVDFNTHTEFLPINAVKILY